MSTVFEKEDLDEKLTGKIELPGMSRRKFLITLAGGSVVAVLASCTPSVTTAPQPSGSQNGGGQSTPAEDVFVTFSAVEAETVKAACGRLIPGNAQDPGAIEAGAYIYIDRTLAGYNSSLLETYRRGIIAMNAYSQSRYSGMFSELSASQQDAVLSDMQSNQATGFYAPGAAQFFGMLLNHTFEGMFCDPVHGGNRDAVGWQLIGYPGAQHSYAESDMVIGADQANKTIQTLADLQGMPMELPDSGF